MSELRKCDVCGKNVHPCKNHPVSGLKWSDFSDFQNCDKQIEYVVEDVCNDCHQKITKLTQRLIEEKSEVKK